MKRIVPFLFALIFLVNCGAVSAISIKPYSSLYISRCTAFASCGTNSGEMKVSYDVSTSKLTTTVGVKKIEVYKASGAKIATITGTTQNGLLKIDATRHSGSYTYSGISGQKYYFEVYFFAEDANGSDTKSSTTSTVTAP